jgi:NADH:ubiquinone oxidoreductase subunit 5 (subunit L)/multisubunit Na+/H+ antiporter MnhA subunit
LQVSKRTAIHGLNIAIAAFTGISAYGLIGYFQDSAAIAEAATLQSTLLFAAGIAASIAGICWFGAQLDRRKSEERKAEERRLAEESARKGRRKPVRP